MGEARWLGRVRYDEALVVQRHLHAGESEYLLLLEHPSVYTLGVRADVAHLLVDPASVGAEVFSTDRGGDVTYHGPGQLIGYPIVSVPVGPDSTPTYVHLLESVIINVLARYGLLCYTLAQYPGVWTGSEDAPRKIAAIGVKLTRGRSMHGFALNVDPDLAMFGHIIPCGIADKAVTSMAAEGVSVGMLEVVHEVTAEFGRLFDWEEISYHGIDDTEGLGSQTDNDSLELAGSTLERRLNKAGFVFNASVPFVSRKPQWVRREVHLGEEYRSLEHLVRGLGLVTVCEEAGCPNIYECWKDGTATFMINGERCTRACAFCLIDTSKPLPLDQSEPDRVAEAVAALNLNFAVVTAVTRDDLPDGGAGAFAATIAAIRDRSPKTSVEVLIPDFQGNVRSLETVFVVRPDVLNHNLETVLRLHRAIRPSARYARTLSVLAQAKDAGLVAKSGLIVGMGETVVELKAAMRDLANVGVDILTVGQYLRPTRMHLPVARYYRPEEFSELGAYAMGLGFRYVEASPLARSSYHAKQGSEAARMSATVQ
ncbi:MAG: lipoyl synthase [Ferrimicrobium sp.]